MRGAPTQSPRESLTMRSLPTESTADETSALCVENPVCPHTSESVGGLQMAHDFHPRPVMVEEVVVLVRTAPPGVIVDGTVGGGGHAAAILDALPAQRLLGIDRDPAARGAAAALLRRFGHRAAIGTGRLGRLADAVANSADFVASSDVVAVLMDLGVSSPQLDDPTRGFSYRSDAALDMRMDPT